MRHYAGSVWYDASGFLEKNRDVLKSNVVDILIESQNSVRGVRCYNTVQYCMVLYCTTVCCNTALHKAVCAVSVLYSTTCALHALQYSTYCIQFTLHFQMISQMFKNWKNAQQTIVKPKLPSAMATFADGLNQLMKKIVK